MKTKFAALFCVLTLNIACADTLVTIQFSGAQSKHVLDRISDPFGMFPIGAVLSFYPTMENYRGNANNGESESFNANEIISTEDIPISFGRTQRFKSGQKTEMHAPSTMMPEIDDFLESDNSQDSGDQDSGNVQKESQRQTGTFIPDLELDSLETEWASEDLASAETPEPITMTLVGFTLAAFSFVRQRRRGSLN